MLRYCFVPSSFDVCMMLNCRIVIKTAFTKTTLTVSIRNYHNLSTFVNNQDSHHRNHSSWFFLGCLLLLAWFFRADIVHRPGLESHVLKPPPKQDHESIKRGDLQRTQASTILAGRYILKPPNTSEVTTHQLTLTLPSVSRRASDARKNVCLCLFFLQSVRTDDGFYQGCFSWILWL